MRKRLERLWRDSNHLVEGVGFHVFCFRLARSCQILIRRIIQPNSSQRAVLVPVPDSEVRLLVRPFTSDVIVFHDVFHVKEHEWTLSTPPRVIVDAGAYTGLSASYFAMRYPEARVIALEPDAQNFALLNRNVSSFKNVQTINGALWSQSGMLNITDPGSGAWSFRVAMPADPSVEPASV